MKKKKMNKVDIRDTIIIFCTMITAIAFTWLLFEELINSGGILFQVFFTLVFGFGGIGLGIILTYHISEILKKLKQIEKRR